MKGNRAGTTRTPGRHDVATDSDAQDRYLLFVGPRSQGTGGQPVATFTDEDEARRAFVNQRLESAAPENSARLAKVDDRGSTHVLCWFGSGNDPSLPALARPDTTHDRSRKDEDVENATHPEPCVGADILRGHERGTTRPASPQLGNVRSKSGPTGPRSYRPLAIAAILAAATVVFGARYTTDGGWRRSDAKPQVQSSGSDLSPLVGYELVSEQAMTLRPESLRDWDTTAGPHEVTVLAGTLSVDDGYGHHRDYRAGESYLAGWFPYTTSSGTPAPVRVLVRYLRPAGQDSTASPAPND